jgi:hypothetical protein
MYSEKLETLIKATLVDGNITDKERQVLLNRAKAEGIDLDEFEVILDARLAELQNTKQAESPQPKKSKKYGEVNKCPSCGAVVPSLAGRCSECGFEFSGITENVTVKKIAENIEKISQKWEKEIANTTNNPQKRWILQNSRDQELVQAIATTPIPVGKSDLFEFIVVAQTSALSPVTPYLMADAYMAKCEEAILKAKILFPKDEILESLCAEFEVKKQQYPIIHEKQPRVSKRSPRAKVLLGVVIFYIIFFIVTFLICFFEGY